MSKYPVFFLYTFVLWLFLAAIILNHHFGEYLTKKYFKSENEQPDIPRESEASNSLEIDISKELSIATPNEKEDYLPPRPREIMDQVMEKKTEQFVQQSTTISSRKRSYGIKNKKKQVPDYRYSGPDGTGISWRSFVTIENQVPDQNSNLMTDSVAKQTSLLICGSSLVDSLAKPGLSDADYKWCQWALSSSGGRVQVGLLFTPSTLFWRIKKGRKIIWHFEWTRSW